MTLQEINDLTVEDVQDILESNIIRLSEDVDHVPTQEEIDAEFIVYKSVLTAVENERLRVQDIKDRISALSDSGHTHAILNSQLPNAALHFKKILSWNKEVAEVEVSMYEAKDAELKVIRDEEQVLTDRKDEYPSIEEIVVALIEDDQEVLSAIKAKRAETKVKFPKK